MPGLYDRRIPLTRESITVLDDTEEEPTEEP